MLGTRNYPVVIGGGIAVLVFSLVGAAAITGVLPSASERKASASGQIAKPTACRNCGVVAAIRPPASKRSPYRVVLRMEDGSERIVSQAAEPDFGVGARVRLVGRILERG
jgi:outer membrane lipoprotein SlyB